MCSSDLSEATDLSTQVDKVAEAIVKEQKAKTDKKDLRNEDHEAYIAFRKDSQKGISLLNKAIKALLKFYQKNKLGMAMAQEDPSDKYTYDQDKAPEGFKKSYGGRKGESRGIVAILTLIRDDMVKQLKKAEGQESEQVAEYRSFVQETNDSIDSMNDNKRSLKGQLAQNEEDRDNTQEALEDNRKLLSETDSAAKALAPRILEDAHELESHAYDGSDDTAYNGAMLWTTDHTGEEIGRAHV